MSSSHRKQTQTIEQLKQSVNGLQDTVYQLIGGLFNHQTQSDVIEMHVESLNSFKCKDREEIQKKIQDAYIWPTTRQGDALELRMNAMELRLHYLEQENAEQKAKILKLEAEKASKAHMKDAEVAIREIKEAVRHIGAGLYNQETQKSAWRQLKTMFYHDGCFEEMEEDELEDWKVNTSKWENIFTTRQGDICEEKIALIEHKLSNIMKALLT
jgi:hypothetical protein